MSSIAYYFEGWGETLCRDCAEACFKNEGIETEEEINYILDGPDYPRNNEMERWPQRWEKNNRWHSKGDYKRDLKTKEILFDEDVKITKKNRPSAFADVPNKDEVIAISDYDHDEEGIYCGDCHEELQEPDYFDCQICNKHMARGEGAYRLEREVDKELEKTRMISEYRLTREYYVCEECVQKRAEKEYKKFFAGVSMQCDVQHWSFHDKWMYVQTLLNNDKTLLALQEHLKEDVVEAVKHGWSNGRYRIPRTGADFNADYHGEMLELLNQYIDVNIDYDMTWGGVAVEC